MKIPNFKHVGALKDIIIYLMLRKAENPITKTAVISMPPTTCMRGSL